jgi:hypothetical protein
MVHGHRLRVHLGLLVETHSAKAHRDTLSRVVEGGGHATCPHLNRLLLGLLELLLRGTVRVKLLLLLGLIS